MIVKQGDWVWYEFQLCMVDNINQSLDKDGLWFWDYRDGYMCYGGGRSNAMSEIDGECFPLTLKNKVISESFAGIHSRIHKKGMAGLNYPDIHRHLVMLWSSACELPENAVEELRSLYKQAEEFADNILSVGRDITIDGVRVFRR